VTSPEDDDTGKNLILASGDIYEYWPRRTLRTNPNQSRTIAGSNEREHGAANDGEHLFNLLSEAIRRPPG
jgi:hypothetical protein